MARPMRRAAGSLVLLAVVALVVFADLGSDGGSVEPRATGDEERTARALVLDIVDGDTVEVMIDGETEDLRYIGIDTPETVKPGEPVQCFGPQASAANERLVEGRRVRLVFDRERRDVYGRLLAYLYLPLRAFYVPRDVQSTQRGEFFNAALVRRGLARSLTIPPNDRFAARFERLELAAARAGRGLWDACGP
jgi:micrococcal nuclease